MLLVPANTIQEVRQLSNGIRYTKSQGTHHTSTLEWLVHVPELLWTIIAGTSQRKGYKIGDSLGSFVHIQGVPDDYLCTLLFFVSISASSNLRR